MAGAHRRLRMGRRVAASQRTPGRSPRRRRRGRRDAGRSLAPGCRGRADGGRRGPAHHPRRRCSSSGCATRRRRGSSRTTRRTRSSWRATSCWTARTPTATTTATPGSSASTASTGARPSASASEQVALQHFAYFPGTVLTRGGLAPAARAVRRLPPASCCSPRSACSPRRCCSPARSPWRLAAGAVLAATRSPCARRGSAVATRPASCSSCSRSRSAHGRRFAGPRRRASRAPILLKQFALVAVPFIGAMILASGQPRRSSWKAAACLRRSPAGGHSCRS